MRDAVSLMFQSEIFKREGDGDIERDVSGF
jgi:hypothetical protein